MELEKEKYKKYERRFSILWKTILSILSFITLFLFGYQTGFIIQDNWECSIVFFLNMLIEIAFIGDIFILLLKSFTVKGDIISGFNNISKFRIKSFYFYQDLFAAFPSVILEEFIYKNVFEVNFLDNLCRNDVLPGYYDLLYIFKLFKIRYAFQVIDKVFNILNINLQGDIRRLLKLAIALGFTVHIMA